MSTLQVEGRLEPNQTYVLTRAITAFGNFPGHVDADSFGTVCELPGGADLEICGEGFNERTVRARHGGCYYFVFWRDLALATAGPAVQRGLVAMA